MLVVFIKRGIMELWTEDEDHTLTDFRLLYMPHAGTTVFFCNHPFCVTNGPHRRISDVEAYSLRDSAYRIPGLEHLSLPTSLQFHRFSVSFE